MSIRKLRSGRVPTATALDYVGEAGTIFWDETIGRLKLSDGETPGGSPLPIYVAAPGIVGGIKPGPGVIISNDGTLVIDSTGLTFNFGDFIASINEGPSDGAILSSKNANQDISIVSNGTGTVNVVGDFHIHKTDSTLEGALTSTPVFSVDRTGVTTILVPNTVTTSGGVEIVGNSLGVFQTPLNTGVMLHVTGNDPDGVASPSRIYNDAIAGYSGWIGRRYNGTSAIPTAVQSNDEVMRLGANAYRSGGFNAVGGSNIRFVSTDNQSALTQGMKIDFYSTPQGQPLSSIVKVMTVEGGVGVTATKFLGPLTGDVTGNITGTAPAGTLTGTTLASNVVTSSLTSVGTLGSLTVTNDVYAGNLHGKLYRPVRDAGVIGTGGTLTIDFTADSIVYCTWGDGMTINYQNYVAGRIVKVIATKTSGGNNDPINLDGITAANVSNGATATANIVQGTTAFIEFVCTGTTIGSVYAKL